MNDIINLWTLILESNTFNFIVLVVILAVIMQKLKLGDALERLKIEIITKIEDSKLARENAMNYFQGAKSKIEHIDDEISEKLSLAKSRADNIADSIAEAANRKIKQIENNAQKVVQAEEKTLFTSLTQDTANSSVDLARKFVKFKLQQDPALHNKYIDESIEELDKVTI